MVRGYATRTVFWLVFLLAVPALAQSSLVFHWGGNPLNVTAWPPCSKFVATMCRTGYTLRDVTTTSSPVVISSTITKSALIYTLTPLPSVGTHVYDLVTNARGSKGNAVHSAPAIVKVSVPSMSFSPPTGFAAKASSSSVVFTWTARGTRTIPVCSTTVTAACLTTYTLSDITNAPSPVIVSSSRANVLTYTLAPLPKPGSHTYSLVVSGRDQSGISKSSIPAAVTVVVSGTP
jgi:hypothetical protein